MRLLKYRLRVLPLVLLGALGAAACEDDLVAPTPDPDPITETHSGTLTPSGGTTYPFDVTHIQGNRVRVTVRALTPDTEVIGISLGTWNSITSTCQAVLANDFAVLSATLTGITQTPASLCVRVYDNGNLEEGVTVSYSIEVRITGPNSE